MADEHTDSQRQAEEEEARLKYLGFVQVAALHAAVTFTNLYLYVKDKSGPLKPGVETVEGTVKSVASPVYGKFHTVPNEVLKYVDRKVDESVTGLDSHVPLVVKHVSSQALSVAQAIPTVAHSVVAEVQTSGVKETASGFARTVYTTCEPKARDIYTRYEPKAEQYAASAWRRLNQLPLFPHVAHVVVPFAAYCSEKYNQTVTLSAEKGYGPSQYLPLVPTEKIAEIFGDKGMSPPEVATN